jgi:hypothetical protein
VDKLKAKLTELGVSTPEDRALMKVKTDTLRTLNSIPSYSSLLVLAPVLDLMRLANAVILAENALILGRDGAERRWDKAMADLRKIINRFDFNDDIQEKEKHTCLTTTSTD